MMLKIQGVQRQGCYKETKIIQLFQYFLENGASVVATHNMLRERHGVPNLSYDATLAAHAAAYSKKLCETKTFKHDKNELAAYKEGENLYYGATSVKVDVCLATYKW